MPWLISYILIPLLAVIVSSVPGYVSFLVLGVPTLYYLYKANVTGYGICTLFGALYASIAALVINRRFQFLRSSRHSAQFRNPDSHDCVRLEVEQHFVSEQNRG
jgi:hypothetical protein